MMKWKLLLLVALLPTLLLSQERIDTKELIAEIEKSIDCSTYWEVRYETDLRANELEEKAFRKPDRLPDYNSRDKRIRYRSTIAIPEVYAGTKVTEGPAYLEFSITGPADFTAKISVNGELVTTYPVVDPKTRAMSFPPILLSENAKSGQKFEVEVFFENPHIYPAQDYPLSSKMTSFGGAILVLPELEQHRLEVEKFLINVYSAFYLTTKWQPSVRDTRPFVPERESFSRIPGSERNQLARLLHDTMEGFDLEAITLGNWSRVESSIENTLTRLEPISTFAKQFTVYLVGNAHIDLAWLWRTRESVQIAANTYQSVLNNLAQFPELIYAQSQAQTYQWVKDHRPELFENIRKAHEAGSWDIVGGMWAEPDCNLISGESWIRQILYAREFFKTYFGAKVELGWNPDSFGYNWNMPQFYSKSGIKAFITQKISWNHETRFPWHLFWWEAPDGSRILTYLPPGSYVEKVEYKKMLDQLLNFEHASGFKEVLCLIGFGNHGGGPNIPMLERARLYNSLGLFPNVKFIAAHKYIDSLMERDLSHLPVWKSEMYLENHRGTFTTQAKTKAYNRTLESLLVSTEKLATLAGLYGIKYPATTLEQSWKTVLLNQFHDILPGSSITPVYRDAERTYSKAQHQLEQLVAGILTKLTPDNHSLATSDIVTVFNPSSWQRDDVITLRIPAPASNNFTVKHLNSGKEVDAIIVAGADSDNTLLQFKTMPLAPMSIDLYTLTPRETVEIDFNTESPLILENDFLRVEVNPESGNISSFYDKQNQHELLPEGEEGNKLELHENLPDYWDAWNIKYTGRNWTLNTADEVKLVEHNSLRSVIRIKKSFLGLSKSNWAPTEGYPSSFFIQDLILYKNSPMLTVEMTIDWWEDHTLLKVAFPTTVQADIATYEIPYANIQRSTRQETILEKARFEVPVHRWADLSSEDWGVSMLNDSKYGMDILNGVMRLTLLTSPIWPDPMADRGIQKVRYAIYPHAGDWRTAKTVRHAEEFNSPLLYTIPGKSKRFAKTNSVEANSETELNKPLFTVSSEQVVIGTVKQSHDGKRIIIRLVETGGETQPVELVCARSLKSVNEVTMMEETLEPIPFNQNTFTISVKPYEIKSIAIEIK